jgi:hypothetical protein
VVHDAVEAEVFAPAEPNLVLANGDDVERMIFGSADIHELPGGAIACLGDVAVPTGSPTDVRVEKSNLRQFDADRVIRQIERKPSLASVDGSQPEIFIRREPAIIRVDEL